MTEKTPQEIGNFEQNIIDKDRLNNQASADIGYSYLLDAVTKNHMSEEERMSLVNDKLYGDLEKEKAFYIDLADSIVKEAAKFIQKGLKEHSDYNYNIYETVRNVYKTHKKSIPSAIYLYPDEMKLLLSTGKFYGFDGKKLVIQQIKHGNKNFQISIDFRCNLQLNSFELSKDQK